MPTSHKVQSLWRKQIFVNIDNIENSSTQNTKLIGYFTKLSMNLFEL